MLLFFLAMPIFILALTYLYKDIYSSAYILSFSLFLWVVWNLLCFNIGNEDTIKIKLILGGIIGFLVFIIGFIFFVYSSSGSPNVCMVETQNISIALIIMGALLLQIIGSLWKLNLAINSELL